MQGGSHAWNKSGHLAFTGYPVGSLQVLENRSINEMDGDSFGTDVLTTLIKACVGRLG